MSTGRTGRLEGKIAVVTGGARGIGKAICERMLQEGANVAVLDTRETELKETCMAFSESQKTVVGFNVDISSKSQVEKSFKSIVERFGTIDVLVNNAGIVCPAPLEDVVEDAWDQVVAVNLKGTTFCTQAALLVMKENRYGRIINIGSRACLGKTERTVYAATKAGLIGMTRTWALELGSFNITVNWIGPGLVATELYRQVNPSDSTRTKNLISAIPLKRVGEPEDIANAVVFLSSDESSYITGQTLFVCGGLSIYSSPM
jgi:3-oxoacyl-[acyl-carrier protein] reductase